MFIAVTTLAALSFLFASLLVIANSLLRVDEDPRIDATVQLLPNTNCGACGFPGCRALAEALVSGVALPGKCTVMNEDERTEVATYLGVDVGTQEAVVARLACAGGSNVARARARYQGLASCRAAALVAGGGKGCMWGCLGLGDCATVCDFDAINMNEHGLPVVVEEDCTACGDCVDACPKDLFSLHALSHRLWVACKNLEHGDQVLDDCEVACTACGKCAVDAPAAIAMIDNLPVVNYAADHAVKAAIERCPTGAIVWWQPDGTAQVGHRAHKVLRRGTRAAAST